MTPGQTERRSKIAEGSKELEENGGWIGLSMRFQRADDLAGKTMKGRLG